MKLKLFVLIIFCAQVSNFYSQTYMMNIYGNSLPYGNGTVISRPVMFIDSVKYTVPLPITSSIGSGVTFDNYTYSSIILGNGQEWMTENLRTTIYANGDPIVNITDPIQWQSVLNTGLWAYYNNDNQLENPHGKLYNGYAIADSRNVCPSGWHVPSVAEWDALGEYLAILPSGYYPAQAGGKLKSVGNQFWQSPNLDATNAIGFSAMPGGLRSNTGVFSEIGLKGYWWTSTIGSPNYFGYYRSLSFDTGIIMGNYLNRKSGLSVRCLKN